MDSKTVIIKIQLIVRDVLDNDSLLIDEQSEITNFEGWDSLAHINIVSQIENEFGIRFSLDELARFLTLGEIIQAIDKKIL